MDIQSPELFQTRPRAILFDIDNTLYPYDPSHKAAMAAVTKKVVTTFSITEEECNEAYKAARDGVKESLPGVASSHSRLLYFQRMLELLGLGSQCLWALDLEQTYWRIFLSEAQLFDEAQDFLDDLRLAGIPVAAVTDLTAQIQFRKLLYFGLETYFRYIVTSEEAGFDKPHKAPFELALEKLDTEPGEHLWMIGDNPVSDIEGAKTAVSAVTVQKCHRGVKKGPADAFFTSYDKLRQCLMRLPVKD